MRIRQRYMQLQLGLVVCLVLGGLWIPPLWADPGVEETAGSLRLNLKECLQHALKNHPSLHEVKWDIALREADVQQAQSGYYPTGELVNVLGMVNDASGNILKYRQGGIDELGPFTRLEGQIVYPLFTWGKIRSGLKAASKGLEQELLSEDERKAQVIREVKEFYYTLLYTKQVQQLLGDIRGGFEQAVKTAEAELEKGKISQTDVLQLRIGYASVAKDIPKLRNGIILTRAALVRAMGLPDTTVFEPTDTTLTPEPAHLKDLQYYVERLFANRPEWQKLQIGIQAKEAELQVVTADYFPTLFLAAPIRYGYAPGRSRQTNPFAYEDFNFAQAGPVLGLRWSLGFAETRAKVSRTHAELMKLKSQKKTALTGFPLEVKEAYFNVKEATERMEITEDGRKAGRALVALGAANVELGIGDQEAVFQGLGSYTQASNDYYEAVRDYNIALAKLSQVIGEEVAELEY